MSIQRLTPDIVGVHEKFLLYGEPKTGKTFAAMTAPSPVFILSVGNFNEMKTAFGAAFKKKHPDQELFFAVAEESMDERGHFDEAVGFDHACDLLDEALNKDDDPDDPFEFSTVVVDNATVLGNYAMNKAMEVNYEGARSKEKTSLQRLRDANIVIPGDNDWMSQMSLMGQFVTWLFRIPKHVVLVAHEWHEETSDRSSHSRTITQAKPLFTGKQRTDIPAMFENVWRFHIDGQFYVAQTSGERFSDTSGSFPIIAGTRVDGALPKSYRDVNLTEAIKDLQKEAHS